MSTCHYYLDHSTSRGIHLPSLSMITTGVTLFCTMRLGPGVVRASTTVNSSSPSTMVSSSAESIEHASAPLAEPGPKVRGIEDEEKSTADATNIHKTQAINAEFDRG